MRKDSELRGIVDILFLGFRGRPSLDSRVQDTGKLPSPPRAKLMKTEREAQRHSISERARELGFSRVGFARAGPARDAPRLREWIEAGRQGRWIGWRAASESALIHAMSSRARAP
jgi:hypothetical protein